MELKTDAILKGPIWADTLERLVGTVFKTYWDVYALSISIGMMHDCQIESDDMVPEGYDAEPKSVPRTVLCMDWRKTWRLRSPQISMWTAA